MILSIILFTKTTDIDQWERGRKLISFIRMPGLDGSTLECD